MPEVLDTPDEVGMPVCSERPTKPIAQLDMTAPVTLELQLADPGALAKFFEEAARAVAAGKTIKIVIE